MLVASARPLAVGAEVEFKFQLDDGVVALAGTRRWWFASSAIRSGWAFGS